MADEERAIPPEPADESTAAAMNPLYPHGPHSSITDLAREQGLLGQPAPDYARLIGDLFEDEEDARRFREEIQENRRRNLPPAESPEPERPGSSPA